MFQNDYFITKSTENTTTGSAGQTYTEGEFKRCFRMSCSVFNRVKKSVLEGGPQLFRFGHDATDIPSATTDQNIIVALRQLSLGIGVDAVTEYIRLSDSRIPECRN